MSDWATLTPLLVHIQANLDQDLGLEELGLRAQLSPTHLQRVFKAAIGESPRSYVSRLRVERAAFRLLVQDSTVSEIATQCGFPRVETFIRAFRKQYGTSPGEYRVSRRAQVRSHQVPRDPIVVNQFSLSRTRVIDLRPIHIAFRRHVGPYEDVPESMFDELNRWAVRRRIPNPRVWIGVGHDAPGATAPDKLRFDAGLIVPEAFASGGSVGYQLVEGGPHAVTTHVGSYDSLGAAYAKIFPRLLALPDYDIVGLPALEVYHASRINVRYAMNHTDICLPLRRKAIG
jgi:AraC family transcriptional regulator